MFVSSTKTNCCECLMHESKCCFTHTHTALLLDLLTVKHASRADPVQLRVKWSQARVCSAGHHVLSIKRKHRNVQLCIIEQALISFDVFAFSLGLWMSQSADSLLINIRFTESPPLCSSDGLQPFCLHHFLFSVLSMFRLTPDSVFSRFFKFASIFKTNILHVFLGSNFEKYMEEVVWQCKFSLRP